MSVPRILYFGRSHAAFTPDPGRPVAYHVQVTGEHRPPRLGEWYLDDETGEAFRACDVMDAPRWIIERRERVGARR